MAEENKKLDILSNVQGLNGINIIIIKFGLNTMFLLPNVNRLFSMFL